MPVFLRLTAFNAAIFLLNAAVAAIFPIDLR